MRHFVVIGDGDAGSLPNVLRYEELLEDAGPGAYDYPELDERQARGRDERVGLEHADQDDVEEEAFGHALLAGEIAMVEIGRHDAGIVRAVPASRSRAGDERHPKPDRR